MTSNNEEVIYVGLCYQIRRIMRQSFVDKVTRPYKQRSYVSQWTNLLICSKQICYFRFHIFDEYSCPAEVMNLCTVGHIVNDCLSLL